MNEIVEIKIAKIANEKGYKEYTDKVYDLENLFTGAINVGETIGDNELYAPTYHQLIDWVFKIVKGAEALNIGNVEWFEFWYDILKDCPLKYEFKGRLLKWFEQNNYILQPNLIEQFTEPRKWGYELIYGSGEDIINTDEEYTYNTREEAENEGILKIFKLIKGRY
jgi:hypothetical protein